MWRSLLVLAALLGSAIGKADVFYYNTVTGASVWERPASMPILDESSGRHYWVVDGEATWDPPQEIAWVPRKDDEGHKYYENIVTHEVTWEPPEDVAWTTRSADTFYYVNTHTKEATWDRPPVLGFEDEDRKATYYVGENGATTWEKPVDAAWTKHEHEGRHFYHNEKTQETSWDIPPRSAFAWHRTHVEM